MDIQSGRLGQFAGTSGSTARASGAPGRGRRMASAPGPRMRACATDDGRLGRQDQPVLRSHDGAHETTGALRLAGMLMRQPREPLPMSDM